MVWKWNVSPALLAVTIISLVAGSAAGLLGVTSNAAPSVSAPTDVYRPPAFVVGIVLVSPLFALALIAVFSASDVGDQGSKVRVIVASVAIVGMLLLGVFLATHPSGPPPLGALGGIGSGTGNSTGQGARGGTNGSGTIGHNGTKVGGNNSTNNTTVVNRTGGGGSGGTGPGNGTHNGSGGYTKGPSRGGNSGSNALFPPGLLSGKLAWIVFIAAVATGGVLGVVLVPQVAARWRRRRTPLTTPPSTSTDAVVMALSRAATSLEGSSDPRAVIGQLYRDLVSHVAPPENGTPNRTPEEIRDTQLLPLGVRPVAADHLTRLFEEASYSSHTIGPGDVVRAREAISMAEFDLRQARPAG